MKTQKLTIVLILAVPLLMLALFGVFYANKKQHDESRTWVSRTVYSPFELDSIVGSLRYYSGSDTEIVSEVRYEDGRTEVTEFYCDSSEHDKAFELVRWWQNNSLIMSQEDRRDFLRQIQLAGKSPDTIKGNVFWNTHFSIIKDTIFFRDTAREVIFDSASKSLIPLEYFNEMRLYNKFNQPSEAFIDSLYTTSYRHSPEQINQ